MQCPGTSPESSSSDPMRDMSDQRAAATQSKEMKEVRNTESRNLG